MKTTKKNLADIKDQAYTEGHRRVLSEAIRNLGAEGTEQAWRIERQEVVAMLRSICEEYGDNDWPDNLHLYQKEPYMKMDWEQQCRDYWNSRTEETLRGVQRLIESEVGYNSFFHFKKEVFKGYELPVVPDGLAVALVYASKYRKQKQGGVISTATENRRI